MKVKRKFITWGAFFLFALSMFLYALPLSYLFSWFGNTDKARDTFHRIICNYFRFFAKHIPSVNVVVNGVEQDTFSKPAIIISNHQSHLDLLCLLMLTPRMVALTNNWVWKNPFYGKVIRYAQFYPVSDGLEQNTQRLKELVKRGYSVLVFPEGTRSANCQILPFHQGAFYFANQLQVDILPVMLHGPGKVLSKSDFTLYPGIMRIEIGKRVPYNSTQFGTTTKEQAKKWRHHYQQQYNQLSHECE